MDKSVSDLVGLIDQTLKRDKIVYDKDHHYVIERIPSFSAAHGTRHQLLGMDCISVGLPKNFTSEDINRDYCRHTARGCDIELVRLPKFGQWVMYAYDIKETWTTKDAGFIDAEVPVIELNDTKSKVLGVYGPFEVPSGLTNLL